MSVQHKVGIDAGPVGGVEPGITANFLVMASFLSVVVPTVMMFAVVAGVLVLLR